MKSPPPALEPESRGDPSTDSIAGEAIDVFEQVATDVRERIRRDAKRFDDDSDAVALVEYLAEHLLDADLDIAGWRRRVGKPPDLAFSPHEALRREELHSDIGRIAPGVE